jgi:hypothetical protein
VNRSCNYDHSFSEDGSASQDDQLENKQDPQKFDDVAANADADAVLVKQSCHDSGIDIRDTPLPSVPVIPNKKVGLLQNYKFLLFLLSFFFSFHN